MFAMSLGNSASRDWLENPQKLAMEVFLAGKFIDLNGGFPSAMLDYQRNHSYLGIEWFVWCCVGNFYTVCWTIWPGEWCWWTIIIVWGLTSTRWFLGLCGEQFLGCGVENGTLTTNMAGKRRKRIKQMKWRCPKMWVSLNHPFWEFPIYWNLHMNPTKTDEILTQTADMSKLVAKKSAGLKAKSIVTFTNKS